MKNQGCLLMRGGRGLDINRQSLLRNMKVFADGPIVSVNYNTPIAYLLHRRQSSI